MGVLPVNSVQDCNMHQESSASASVLFCKIGLLQGCFQSPSDYENKWKNSKNISAKTATWKKPRKLLTSYTPKDQIVSLFFWPQSLTSSLEEKGSVDLQRPPRPKLATGF